MNSKKAVIIQARMGSSRFPGKMMSVLGGMPLAEYIYRRCELSSCGQVVMAISADKSDDVLYDYCLKRGIKVVRGDLRNVLLRYIQAAGLIGAEYIIRVCGDTPFVDIALMEILLNKLVDEKLDYISARRDTCASGFYCEAISTQALKKSLASTSNADDLEHVTKFINDNPGYFRHKLIDAGLNPEYAKKIRLTIDYPEDIVRAGIILKELKNSLSFTASDILGIVGRKQDALL